MKPIQRMNKKLSLIAAMVVYFVAGAIAFAAEPLKIDVDMINTICKIISPDMLQCQGIKAMWADPDTHQAQSLPSVDVLLQWDPLAYNFKIKEVLGAQCNNTIRVQVASVITGEPLPNVAVFLRGQNVATDEDGIARFTGVKTGTASINSVKDGYEMDSIETTVVCDVLKHIAVRLMPKS